MELRFNQVEAILAGRHLIAEEAEAAFRGRLQHLQRLKFPPGTNTGKGKKASYGWTQLFQLAFAIDLIEIGLTPDFAAKIVTEHSSNLVLACASLGEIFVVMQLDALNHLKFAERKAEAVQIWVLPRQTLFEQISDNGPHATGPTIISNPIALALVIIDYVNMITPDDFDANKSFCDWALETRQAA